MLVGILIKFWKCLGDYDLLHRSPKLQVEVIKLCHHVTDEEDADTEGSVTEMFVEREEISVAQNVS
ncbi:hypothetical protein O0535_05635 [Brevibacillus halotolerans]|uniref:Uncharacterized protein n=1 Tax=Brevibacillus halotolerans TaxID=1507437 RepID=A0ABT4HU12_9BACL|nr:hypothetical protein [Brevibacillus halotolerans]